MRSGPGANRERDAAAIMQPASLVFDSNSPAHRHQIEKRFRTLVPSEQLRGGHGHNRAMAKDHVWNSQPSYFQTHENFGSKV
jgi:hypothetical protein